MRADIRALARRVRWALDRFCVPSFAQEGEDRILCRLTEGVRDGFYVDVGAHHPRRFSNTYLFYLHGWRGINIDPDLEAAKLFARERPRDIHVAMGISDEPGTLSYHRFDESALNTFDQALADERARLGRYRRLPTVQVRVARLSDVLSEHLPAARSITFLSVDAEGYDVRVLRSNDWVRFRPRFVVAESLESTLDSLAADKACAFLRSVGYVPLAKTMNSVIYRERAEAAAANTSA
jgi:FkbM family methyltransferase